MRHALRRALNGLAAAALLVALGAGTATGQNAVQAAQTDSQRGITVKAVLMTPAYFKAAPSDPLTGKVDLERHIVFAITLDTHSGDLSKYDVVKNALLRNDRGQQVIPLQWVATADGSHHREGGLIFPKVDELGRAIDGQARSLELIVRSLGGVAERALRWTLPIE